MNYDFIRRLEYKKGKIGCSIDTLYKISIVLNVTMDKFFEDITEEKSTEKD